MSERPAKRVRQACEPCRRKKTRCPGEKPICSNCARLRQNCYYADDGLNRVNERTSTERTPMLTPSRVQETHLRSFSDVNLEDRLKSVEAQLAEVLSNQVSTSRSESRHISNSPVLSHLEHTIRTPNDSRLSSSKLPPYEAIVSIAKTYLLYCDCQPLPVFCRKDFVESINERDPEVIFSVLALAIRFSDDDIFLDNQSELVTGYVEAARSIISGRIFGGRVELSTLQSLCLLSLVDFTNGNTRQASVHSSLAMSLAQNAGLTAESHAPLSNSLREERRRCFWSLFLLKRLHGAEFNVIDFAGEDNFPWYPETTGRPLNPGQFTSGETPSLSIPDTQDKGVVAYAIQLSEVWFKITRYARRRGSPSTLPPWSPQSDYAIIMAQQMDFETRTSQIHRFKSAKFSQRSTEDLHANRDYWGPWLFIQFLYHTNLCLLNNPLLLSLRLKNIKSAIPEIFLQHISDLISSHASWVIRYIDMLEAKSFKVSDPFLAHCVAIIATIYLQECFAEDPIVRQQKRDNFDKCLRFIRDFKEWPHVARMAEKLQRLCDTVSSTYTNPDAPPQSPNRSLLIDLGQFWEILEYSSSSEIPTSARRLFGPSLYSASIPATHEISHASSLPEPTRVDRQEFEGSDPNSVSTSVVNLGGNGPLGQEQELIQPPFNYSDDELAPLQTNRISVPEVIPGSIDESFEASHSLATATQYSISAVPGEPNFESGTHRLQNARNQNARLSSISHHQDVIFLEILDSIKDERLYSTENKREFKKCPRIRAPVHT
ncbi:C6 transcription factor [Sclerotinia borealis F-4128]|uniref:C6 transcription factor n=1 Tax=Sclerotinia borealis (strain F-4128) TaxID=1432307 RepID=W9C6Z6_SCLBF|nr:C6 transcription factor [Sclerotinia borealis F-4128]